MNNTEKKLNQILNLLNLVHSENTLFLDLLAKNAVTDEESKKLLEGYILQYTNAKIAIMSGVYEEEVEITS